MDVLDVPAAASHVQSGDHLFGIAYTTCVNCEKERAYWIYFVVAKGGWYKEMDGVPWGKKIQIPKSDATENQIGEVIDSQVPQKNRILYREQFRKLLCHGLPQSPQEPGVLLGQLPVLRCLRNEFSPRRSKAVTTMYKPLL